MGLPAEGTIIQTITLPGYGPLNVGQIGRIDTDQNGLRWRCIQVAPAVLYVEDSGQFGNGVDGDLTVAAGTTQISAYKQYRNLQVDAGAILECDFSEIKVQGTLLNNGTIRGRLFRFYYLAKAYTMNPGGVAKTVIGAGNVGTASTSNVSAPEYDIRASTPGGSGGGGGGGVAPNNGGAAGQTFYYGPWPVSGSQVQSAAGGIGAANGTVGWNGSNSPIGTSTTYISPFMLGLLIGLPGAGGGSGGLNNLGTGGWTAISGKGGDGGRGGNFLKITTNRLDGTGTFNCDGENGENGGNATDAEGLDGQAGGGGGGAGGSGGCCIILYRTSSGTVIAGDVTSNAGTSGTGGNPVGAAGIGGTAGISGTGIAILQQI